jgi:hypothetical protein
MTAVLHLQRLEVPGLYDRAPAGSYLSVACNCG